ncbi:MAG: radical SAM family heme chaperone HemW [Muribaculaceae bacterium]|nr:radical SAM family heme chaperone HemW [Muribaculaceae bacterium]
MINRENFGIYIHVPFCRRKCLYCDFYSIGERLADWDLFLRALKREFEAAELPGGGPCTLYIGGGTPSLAPPEFIAGIREMVKCEVGEFTIEVNPDDVTPVKSALWREAGVNRVSMGVQSLVDKELTFIGRRHSAEEAMEAYSILRRDFGNVSLDLMFGLPGQTIETLESTLEGFIGMKPEHISAYSLMYEERTALTRLRDSGKIREVAEEDTVGMFGLVSERLHEAGYERYEISNYSRPGFRSRHNSAYWKGLPYIGLGPGAHSYDGDRTRRRNAPDLSLYLRSWGGTVKSEEIVNVFIERLTQEELREEYVMTRLRMAEGIGLEDYKSRFGEEELRRILINAAPYEGAGMLAGRESGHLALTDSGVMVSDEVIVGLF